MAMGGDANNIEIKVVVDAQGAIKLLDQTGKEMGKLEQSTAKADKGISSFQGSIIALNQAIDLTGRVFNGLTGAVSSTFQALAQAEKIEGIRAGFENLQASIGNLAVDKLPALQKATGGLIGQMELMQQANNAVLLSVDDGSGKYEKAAESVVKLGRAMGIDAVKALESFTVGTARQSKLWLDNLGIIVQVEDAHKRYADQIHKSVADLSDQEKQLAFTAAAYEAVELAAANLGVAQDTAATAARKASVAYQDLTVEFYESLSSSSALAEAMTGLKAVIESLDTGALVKGFEAVIGVFTEVGKMAYETGEALGWLLDKVSFGQLRTTAAATLGAATKAGEALTKNEKEVTAAIDKHRKAQEELVKTTVKRTAATSSLNKEVKAQSDSANKLKTAQEALLAQISRMTGSDGVSKQARQVTDLYIAMDSGAISAEQFAQALKDLYESASSSEKELKLLGDSLTDGERGFKDFQRQAERAAEESLRKFQDALEDSKAGLEDLFSQMGMMPEMGELISANLASMFPETMAAAGPYAAFASVAIEGINGAMETYARDKQAGFKTGKEMVVNMYKGAYESIFGKELGGLFAKIDLAWSKPIVKLFGGLFGSNDLGTVMRRGFGKLFDEAFDALPHGKIKLWVEGELKELDGIDTTKYTGFLEKLPQETAAGFLGVGTAFEEMVSQMGHDMEGFGGQISEILANNMGGSLNNLQMLFEALEVSAEDLKLALEDAYLNGDIAANIFLESSRQIEDLYTQGIPGAFGAVDQALKNFREGALTSGRIAKDAIGDMAMELKQKNPAATFEDLRAEMLAAGYTAEEVNQVFQAFGEAGITNLEELANVTTQQTAVIVDSLEKQGFAFDAPIEKAEQLIKKLDELDGKKVDAYVNVHYTEHDKPDTLDSNTSTQTTSSGPASEGATEGTPRMAQFRSAFISPQLMAAMTRSAGNGGRSISLKKLSPGADYKAASMESLAIQISRMVQESQRYKEILEQLEAGQLSYGKAGKALSAMYSKSANLLQKQALLEAKLAYAIEHRGEITNKQFGKLLQKLEKIGAKIENVGGGIGGENARAASVEEQIKGVMDAFKAGAISIGRANELITGIKSGAGQGLAGFGDISGALAQFSKASTNQELLAAIKNIGIEAKEAGLSMGELMDYMQDKNFKGVEKFFEAVGKGGFNTIDEYIRATEEDLVDLLSKMASANFPFADALTDVREFSHELKSLPELIKEALKGEFELGINVNVTTQSDKNVPKQVTAELNAKIDRLQKRIKRLMSVLTPKQRQSLGIGAGA